MAHAMWFPLVSCVRRMDGDDGEDSASVSRLLPTSTRLLQFLPHVSPKPYLNGLTLNPSFSGLPFSVASVTAADFSVSPAFPGLLLPVASRLSRVHIYVCLLAFTANGKQFARIAKAAAFARTENKKGNARIAEAVLFACTGDKNPYAQIAEAAVFACIRGEDVYARNAGAAVFACTESKNTLAKYAVAAAFANMASEKAGA